MKKWIIAVTALVVMLVAVLFTGYRNNPYQVIDGFTQGTTFHIVYKPDPAIRYLLNRKSFLFRKEIDSLLTLIDHSLSIYEPESVISKINRNDTTVRINDLFRTVFEKAVEVSAQTNGAFDITVGPVVNAWGFGPEEKIAIDSTVIDSLLQYVGMEKVRLENNRILKTSREVRLDVNAIAQGYSVDLISGFLEAKGMDNYLVEIGGEVRTHGKKLRGEDWRIGIDKPVDNSFIQGRDLQVILAFTGRSIATSGNYRKFFEEDGVRYAHTIDPETGYPARNRLLSATVLTDECMTADAFATAFMVMGLDESLKLLSTINNMDAYFICSGENGEFEIHMTEGFREIIVE